MLRHPIFWLVALLAMLAGAQDYSGALKASWRFFGECGKVTALQMLQSKDTPLHSPPMPAGICTDLLACPHA
jgi:hypothetical protein